MRMIQSSIGMGDAHMWILKQVQDDSGRLGILYKKRAPSLHCHPELVSGSTMDVVHTRQQRTD